MKKYFFLFPVIILAGCPMKVSVPLSLRAELKTDSSFIGTYFKLNMPAGETESIKFSILNDTMYRIVRDGEVQDGDITRKEKDGYSGFVTIIDGKKFMSLLKTDADGKAIDELKFIIANFDLHRGKTKDTLFSNILTGGGLGSSDYSTPEDLRSAVEYALKYNSLKYDSVYSGVYVR
ncbi:MAG: hypothetical protein HY064_15560 [Bacteroidetes bacterium]|nr:hypothetical protein [Bacteroidota bacterium]